MQYCSLHRFLQNPRIAWDFSFLPSEYKATEKWLEESGRVKQKDGVWWFEMSKMLTNFTFNLPFCCKVSHSGITSSAFSLPLSEKHIGAELASCLPPSPSATIILRYHPTFWPSSLGRGGGAGGAVGKGRGGREDGEHSYSYNTSMVGKPE